MDTISDLISFANSDLGKISVAEKIMELSTSIQKEGKKGWSDWRNTMRWVLAGAFMGVSVLATKKDWLFG